MSLNKLGLYVLYGPGTALSMSLAQDGTYSLSLQGNVAPLFPRHELGLYGGSDPRAIEGHLQNAARVLPGAADNVRPFPDAAFISVDGGPELSRLYDLYDPPASARAFLDPLFAWVEGPARAQKQKTVAVEARWAAPAARAQDGVGVELVLTSTGPRAAVVSAPRGETLELVLAETGPQADPEAYVSLTGDAIVASVSPPAVLVAPWVGLAPGASLTVALRAAHGLPPGLYRGTLTYHSQESDAERAPEPCLTGVMHLDLGQIRITS